MKCARFVLPTKTVTSDPALKQMLRLFSLEHVKHVFVCEDSRVQVMVIPEIGCRLTTGLIFSV